MRPRGYYRKYRLHVHTLKIKSNEPMLREIEKHGNIVVYYRTIYRDKSYGIRRYTKFPGPASGAPDENRTADLPSVRYFRRPQDHRIYRTVNTIYRTVIPKIPYARTLLPYDISYGTR